MAYGKTLMLKALDLKINARPVESGDKVVRDRTLAGKKRIKQRKQNK